MIIRCAVIESGLVANVIMADPAEYQPEGSTVVASDTANIGDTYADGEFIPTVEPE